MMHSFDTKKIGTTLSLPVVLGIIIGALILGIATGYGVSAFGPATTPSTTTNADGTTETASSEKAAGVKDEKTFPDKAEGKLKEGGLEGEGSYHLERPGGASQNVYLTSSTVDLSKFLGKNVRIWGQTFEAEKAGWLMDVGYIEVK